MSLDLVNVPATRSWREIPQPVKPRAMSTGGRWRLVMAGVRAAALVAFIGGCGWGVWLVYSALQDDPRRMPAAAKAVPVKAPELKTMRDGVLDSAWLARTLELRPGVSLMELDLEKLCERVRTDHQVLTVNMRKIFPDRLEVQITERIPVARIRVDLGGVQRDLLVARDGIVFFGTGFDPIMIRTLPWLDGISLARDGAWFAPIGHMDVVAKLLAEAQFSAPHLYQAWQSVSLARLELDREMEVVLKNGTRAMFTAKGSFFAQLAKFDSIVERLNRIPGARGRVDLTLGREVPVTIEMPATDLKTGGPLSAVVPTLPLLTASSSKTKREL